jgi:Bacterial TSP3 repeat/Right handed beta helix region
VRTIWGVRASFLVLLVALTAAAVPAAAAAHGKVAHVGVANGKFHRVAHVKVAHGRLGLKASRVVQRPLLRPGADADGDGLVNRAESRQTQTNPREFDTDGDGFGDGTEVAAGSNPLDPRSTPVGPPAPTDLVLSPAGSQPGASGTPALPAPDVTPPNTMINSGPSGVTTETSASFAFTSTEAGSTFQCSLDSGSWTTCISPKAYSGLAVGSHAFSVKATDAAGNADASPATRGWTVQATTPPPPTDTTPPETTISSGPAGTTTATGANFEFSSSESGSTYQCSLDSGSWTSCISPKAYSGLAVGSHAFAVKATDAAGNTDASPATRSWTVASAPDTTPPNTSIKSGPASTTTSTSASFSFSSSESGSTFLCSLDSGPASSCTSPKSYSSVGLGTHTFSVAATDAAGNVDLSPATRSWTVTEPDLPVNCTTNLSPGADVADVVSRAAGGAVICLEGGSYGRISIDGAHKSPPVTVRSGSSGRATVGGISLTDPSGLRFIALDITSGSTVTPSGSNIQFIDNDITGVAGIYMFGDYRIGDQISDVLIEGNNIHDLDYSGNQDTGFGYGIEGVGEVRNMTIRDNTIKSPASDYIQSATPINWVVDHNTFLGPSLLGSHEDHQDLWQIFGGGEDITFTNNVARDTETQESLLFQEGAFSNVDVENNLFDHDSRGYTCQIYQSSGLIFRDNTIVGSHWGCLFRDLATSPPGSGYEVDHNVFAGTEASVDVSEEGRAGNWGTYDYNVSSDSSAEGSHSVRNWSPSWSDTTNYNPLGLPFAAGYSP